MPLPALIGGARQRATRTLWAVGKARVPETRLAGDSGTNITSTCSVGCQLVCVLARSHLCHICPFKELIVGFKVGETLGKERGEIEIGLITVWSSDGCP